MTSSDATYWKSRLGLTPHPEGGWYRETYRADRGVALPDRFGGPRPFGTAIYYLLEGGEFSSLHRLKSDELWHFYAGAPLLIHVITPDGVHHALRLGPDFERGERFQAIVSAGCWFGARHERPDAGFSLVGCTVAPGFSFGDFELAQRHELIGRFPDHAPLITSLTRER